MKTQLNNADNNRLISVMEQLAEQNRQLAVVFSNTHHQTEELDDDLEYKEAQYFVTKAIYQVGAILGKRIAENFI